MKKIILLSSMLLTLCLCAKERVEFFLDYNTFYRVNAQSANVEFYFSVPVKQLVYDDSLKASFTINLKVYDKDKLIAGDYFGQYSFLSSEKEKTGGGEAPSQTALNLKPGSYRLKAVVTDLVSKDSAVIDIPQASGRFTIPEPGKNFGLSGVQLGTKILKDAKPGTDFVKNGLMILPNPRKIYRTHNPFLSYYAEAYNLVKDHDYRINWEIYTPDGKFVRKGDAPIEIKATGSTTAVFDKVKIFYLKSGTYKFLLRLTDIGGKDSVYTSNNFYIFRPLDFEKKFFAADSLGDLFDILPEEKISEEFAQLAAIFTTKDKATVDQLNEKGKRGYLKKFWQEREAKDPDARQKFLYLVELADKDYSTVNIKGWNTDRGRVLIKMGEPDKKDINLVTKGKMDHEVWTYFNTNNIFVFADMHGFNDFKLIHSDYPGEKNDPNWETKLQKRSKGGIDMGE